MLVQLNSTDANSNFSYYTNTLQLKLSSNNLTKAHYLYVTMGNKESNWLLDFKIKIDIPISIFRKIYLNCIRHIERLKCIDQWDPQH